MSTFTRKCCAPDPRDPQPRLISPREWYVVYGQGTEVYEEYVFVPAKTNGICPLEWIRQKLQLGPKVDLAVQPKPR